MKYRIFFLTLALSAIAGCGGKSAEDVKSPEDIADEKRVQEEKPIEVDAPALTRAFTKNPKQEEKYKDKVVQVTGKIDKVSESDKEKRTYVKLEGAGGDYKGTSYIWSVSCRFTGADRKTAASQSAGSPIKIKGICMGPPGNHPHIVLKACKIMP